MGHFPTNYFLPHLPGMGKLYRKPFKVGRDKILDRL